MFFVTNDESLGLSVASLALTRHRTTLSDDPFGRPNFASETEQNFVNNGLVSEQPTASN